MSSNHSIRFFEHQFQIQVSESAFKLNPFEQAALPHLRGRILDYGCGLGNLSLAAARTGHAVMAIDASPSAIAHLRRTAETERLDLDAQQHDLRHYRLTGSFDVVVSIGLLMFFDRATALDQLASLKSAVKPGGTLILNLLTQETTYMEMFDPEAYCLFAKAEILASLAAWELLEQHEQDFEAPGQTVKAFLTIIAKKPAMPT